MKEILYLLDNDLETELKKIKIKTPNISLSDEHAYLQTFLLIQIARDLKQTNRDLWTIHHNLAV